MGLATQALVRDQSALSDQAGRRFPRARFRMAAVLAILTTVAALGMIRDEAPVVASGSVVDATGRPIAGAEVRLLGDRPTGPDAVATSGAGGSWWLTGGHRLEPHRLHIAAAGFLAATAELGDARLIVLHSVPSLQGTVVDDAGAPVADATVTLVRPHDLTIWERQTVADGTFGFVNAFTPGQFSISITASDHDPFQSLLHLQADSTQSIRAVLVRQVGTITVTSDPAGLMPLLDGKPLAGCKTPCTLDVLVGRHTLSLDTDLFEPWSQDLDLHNREKLSLGAALVRKQGTLTVTVPAGELAIDGNPVDGTQWSGRLPTGAHTVSTSSDGAWPTSRTVTVGWNQTTTIDLGADLTRIIPGDQAAFLAGLSAYLAAAGGRYGVYIQDLRTGVEFGQGQNDVMEAASDIKVPLAIYLLTQVEAGKVALADTVTLQDSDFMSGTGTLNGTANSGDQYSVRDLLALMITISDNTAWQALQRTLTPEAVDAYAASIGAPDCHQVDDNCTSRELGLMFARLYRGTLLKPTENQLLLDLLSNTIFNERIPYYLGGVKVAHKTGADGGVMNDAGIVFLPGKPFVVSVMTLTDDGATGVQATRDITRAVAHYLRAAT